MTEWLQSSRAPILSAYVRVDRTSVVREILEGLGNCVKHNSKHNSGNGRNCSRVVHTNKKPKKCSDCSFCSWIVPGTISHTMTMCKHNFVCTRLHRPAPRCIFIWLRSVHFCIGTSKLSLTSVSQFPKHRTGRTTWTILQNCSAEQFPKPSIVNMGTTCTVNYTKGLLTLLWADWPFLVESTILGRSNHFGSIGP